MKNTAYKEEIQIAFADISKLKEEIDQIFESFKAHKDQVSEQEQVVVAEFEKRYNRELINWHRDGGRFEGLVNSYKTIMKAMDIDVDKVVHRNWFDWDEINEGEEKDIQRRKGFIVGCAKFKQKIEAFKFKFLSAIEKAQAEVIAIEGEKNMDIKSALAAGIDNAFAEISALKADVDKIAAEIKAHGIQLSKEDQLTMTEYERHCGALMVHCKARIKFESIERKYKACLDDLAFSAKESAEKFRDQGYTIEDFEEFEGEWGESCIWFIEDCVEFEQMLDEFKSKLTAIAKKATVKQTIGLKAVRPKAPKAQPKQQNLSIFDRIKQTAQKVCSAIKNTAKKALGTVEDMIARFTERIAVALA